MLMYQHERRASFSASIGAEVQHSTVATSEELGASAKARREVLQLPNYPRTLQESSFRYLLWFMISTFEREETLKEDRSRTICSLLINTGDKKRDKRDQDAGRALYTSRRKLLKKRS